MTVFFKFLDIVAEALVEKEEGAMDEGSKQQFRKRKKMYLKVLKLQKEEIENEIRDFEDGNLAKCPPGDSGEAVALHHRSDLDSEQGE
eukprot:CAMPEP_0183322810 /NCGR_PEP_ID=MMETSP0160_2-20130417/72711_1 /TAXON_ID=2839 ORGANISM="Odontella Sinensis, Strain Grunow 1884" /NCGR_SAMPLE_ID=MMETSP0160_2 /ASSEMBLY_ACC=CAM_ASM_000250 /LENGTH=87 /DNA_ID=CAMNT_0025490055 /DNA_START=2 /DNA_END=262 /DNA_ORIENTATION=+